MNEIKCLVYNRYCISSKKWLQNQTFLISAITEQRDCYVLIVATLTHLSPDLYFEEFFYSAFNQRRWNFWQILINLSRESNRLLIAMQYTCSWMQHLGVSLLPDCISMSPHPLSLPVTVSSKVLTRLPVCDNNHPCQQDTGEGSRLQMVQTLHTSPASISVKLQTCTRAWWLRESVKLYLLSDCLVAPWCWRVSLYAGCSLKTKKSWRKTGQRVSLWFLGELNKAN